MGVFISAPRLGLSFSNGGFGPPDGNPGTAVYAYRPGNTNNLGVAASVTNDYGTFGGGSLYGAVTPYLTAPPVGTATPATYSCSPLQQGVSGQSLLCPVKGTDLAYGQYDINFSQYNTQLDYCNNTVVEGTIMTTITGGHTTFTIAEIPTSTSSVTRDGGGIPVTQAGAYTAADGYYCVNVPDVDPAPTCTIHSFSATVTSTFRFTSYILGTNTVTATGTCPGNKKRNAPKTCKSKNGLQCNRDNCLREQEDPRFSAMASEFCKTYTTTYNTVPASIPSYLENCKRRPDRVSSACSCLMQRTSALSATSSAPKSTSVTTTKSSSVSATSSNASSQLSSSGSSSQSATTTGAISGSSSAPTSTSSNASSGPSSSRTASSSVSSSSTGTTSVTSSSGTLSSSQTTSSSISGSTGSSSGSQSTSVTTKTTSGSSSGSQSSTSSTSSTSTVSTSSRSSSTTSTASVPLSTQFFTLSFTNNSNTSYITANLENSGDLYFSQEMYGDTVFYINSTGQLAARDTTNSVYILSMGNPTPIQIYDNPSSSYYPVLGLNCQIISGKLSCTTTDGSDTFYSCQLYGTSNAPELYFSNSTTAASTNSGISASDGAGCIPLQLMVNYIPNCAAIPPTSSASYSFPTTVVGYGGPDVTYASSDYIPIGTTIERYTAQSQVATWTATYTPDAGANCACQASLVYIPSGISTHYVTTYVTTLTSRTFSTTTVLPGGCS